MCLRIFLALFFLTSSEVFLTSSETFASPISCKEIFLGTIFAETEVKPITSRRSGKLVAVNVEHKVGNFEDGDIFEVTYTQKAITISYLRRKIDGTLPARKRKLDSIALTGTHKFYQGIELTLLDADNPPTFVIPQSREGRAFFQVFRFNQLIKNLEVLNEFELPGELAFAEPLETAVSDDELYNKMALLIKMPNGIYRFSVIEFVIDPENVDTVTFRKLMHRDFGSAALTMAWLTVKTFDKGEYSSLAVINTESSKVDSLDIFDLTWRFSFLATTLNTKPQIANGN